MMNDEEKTGREEGFLILVFSQLPRFFASSLPLFLGLVFVLNFEILNFDIVSNFDIRASCFILILGEIKKGHTKNLPGEIEKKVGSKPIIL